MTLNSNDLYALRSDTLFFPEQNINGIGTNTPASRGVFVVPSEVPGRPDVTGYVLRSLNNEGKVEWAPSPAFNLKLGDLVDVDLAGLMNGDTIIYDAATQLWRPGSAGGNVIAGDALAFTGSTLNVLYDNVMIGINAMNELNLIDGSITNAKLVNDSISIFNADGLVITGSPVVLGGNVDIGVDATVIRTTGGQTINGSLGVDSLIFHDTGLGTITLEAPTNVTNYTLHLPDSQGSSNTFLKNDGAGNLSWGSPTSVSPGGPDRSIQFNDAGIFGGSSKLTYNGTNVTLTGGTIFTDDLVVTSDARCKRNIHELDSESCKQLIKQIKCYGYHFGEMDKMDKMDNRKHMGCLAQELEKVCPELVYENNSIKAVNYIMMIPLILQSLKTLI
jgi:hypothetical protein